MLRDFSRSNKQKKHLQLALNKTLSRTELPAWESPKLGTCSSTNNEGNLKIKYTRPKNFEIITYATDSLDKHQNHEGWVVRCFPHATGF